MNKNILRFKPFIALLAVFFMSSPGYSQNFWQQTNGPFGGGVQVLASNSSGDIFAGTRIGGVFRSTDNGDTWSPINTGLTATFVSALAINSSGDIFAGTFGGESGVFRSTDNGDTWRQINTGLTNINVVALAINSSGDIFAGTFGGGVFRSPDNGDTWSPINTGLTNTNVVALAINSSGDIFAGTFGGGVFRSVESTTAVEEIATRIPSSFALEQNYPNPFNPSTTIEYSVQKAGIVQIKIHNTLGQLVRTLVNESRPIGEYSTAWDGKNDSGRKVTSGTYFYRLQFGDFISIKKMLLIR